jgi:hypothetical protein
MINIEEKVDVQKSKEFQGRQMSIDPEFFNKMIWLVIKQYKYKIRTSVQELVSNAVDAQVEAGNPDKPVKITLPTALEPTFKLRDYGTGMTPDVVNKIYCNMGASGSSYTNAKKGGFGIGGKSPLGFCDAYNIMTYVDGTYWFYAIYKNEVNGINVDLLSSGETTEENGTEIIIPSTQEQIKDFKKAATRATYFWDIQPEFNLGMEFAPKGVKFSDKFTVYETSDLPHNDLDINYWGKNIVILVDGIPYPVESSMIDKTNELYDAYKILGRENTLVYKIGNGEIKVLQTRESLEDCKFTIDKLNKIGLDIQNTLKEHIEKKVLQTNFVETASAYFGIAKSFGNAPVLHFKDNVYFSSHGVYCMMPDNKKYLFNMVKFSYESRRYSKLKDPKRINQSDHYLDEVQLNNFYLDDLGNDVSEVMKSRRLRYDIVNSKNDIVMLKTDDMPKKLYNMLLNDYGMRLLSSLPMPPKNVATTKAARKAKKLASNKIDVHFMRESASWQRSGLVRTVETIDLNNYKGKVLWLDYNDKDFRMYRREWKLFLKGRGFEIAYISKKYQKHIKDDSRFLEFKEYVDNIELTELERNTVIFNHIQPKRKTIVLLKAAKKSTNKVLKHIADSIIVNHKPHLYEIPWAIKKDVLDKDHQVISKLETRLNFFNKKMQGLNLPDVRTSKVWELTNYINKARL